MGILTLSLYTARQATVGHIVRRIVTFPAFIALVLALLVDPAGPPSWLLSGLRGLAATLTPAALLAIGLHLQLRLEPGRKLPFALGLMIKLLLAPLILYLLFGWLDLHSLAAKVSIFEAAMAPMISSAMLAMMAGLEQRFIASLLGYGIVLSFVTLPGVYWIIQG
jgi:predicted permease